MKPIQIMLFWWSSGFAAVVYKHYRFQKQDETSDMIDPIYLCPEATLFYSMVFAIVFGPLFFFDLKKKD